MTQGKDEFCAHGFDPETNQWEILCWACKKRIKEELEALRAQLEKSKELNVRAKDILEKTLDCEAAACVARNRLEIELAERSKLDEENAKRDGKAMEEYWQAINRVGVLKENLLSEQKHSDELAEALKGTVSLLVTYKKWVPAADLAFILGTHEVPEKAIKALENHRSRRGGK